MPPRCKHKLYLLKWGTECMTSHIWSYVTWGHLLAPIYMQFNLWIKSSGKVTKLRKNEMAFPNPEPVCCSMSSSNCCFLTCIQISQEAGKVVWHFHLFKSFLQFVVIHTVRGFHVVSEAEIDFFNNSLLFPWSSRSMQFVLYFLCLF